MLSGKNLINGDWVESQNSKTTADLKDVRFSQASIEQANQACDYARGAFRAYSIKTRADRATFLRTIGTELEALGSEITNIAMQETGLPEMRLNGERGRTIGQLNMFADVIEKTDYLDMRKDAALPNREPLPRPDLRLIHKAIGPVVVFGASNFPLAFSTAGGDTASALAAGCPVIVKAHQAHPGTAELVAQAINNAIKKCNMPKATFQQLHGSGREVGSALVKHPEITAVGFTGSLAGGRALYDLCHQRPNPIPFYGELGSLNPVFCLADALKSRAQEIGKGWAASLTMGAGQFCTNPGVVIGVKSDDFSKFQQTAIAELQNAVAQKMLTDNICETYQNGVKYLKDNIKELTNIAQPSEARHATPAVFQTDAKTWMQNPHLREEVFGAAGIFVECDDEAQMLTLAENLEGQLTTTLQLNDHDHDIAGKLLPILEEKSGRILCNGFPTGVEVCSAMMHGGPYPASTDVRATSVGTLAITRWLRPISYQNMPNGLLPTEISD